MSAATRVRTNRSAGVWVGSMRLSRRFFYVLEARCMINERRILLLTLLSTVVISLNFLLALLRFILERPGA